MPALFFGPAFLFLPSGIFDRAHQAGGNPRATVAFHDKVMMQAAPFDAAPVELAQTPARWRFR